MHDQLLRASGEVEVRLPTARFVSSQADACYIYSIAAAVTSIGRVTEVAVVVLSGLEGVMMRKTVVIVCAFSLLLSAAVLAGCGSGGGSSAW